MAKIVLIAANNKSGRELAIKLYNNGLIVDKPSEVKIATCADDLHYVKAYKHIVVIVQERVELTQLMHDLLISCNPVAWLTEETV